MYIETKGKKNHKKIKRKMLGNIAKYKKRQDDSKTDGGY